MGTFTSGVQLAQHMEKRLAGCKLSIGKAVRILAFEGARDMRDNMRGTLKERDLRRLGHPYSRRTRILNVKSLGANRGYTEGKTSQVMAKGSVRDLPFNSWTGRLISSIKVDKKSGLTFDLYDTAPQAKFLLSPEGTKYMKPRGLLGKTGLLRKRWKFRQNGMVEAVRRGNRLTP